MASSNFLTWDSPGVNIENDSQYAADSLRSNGAPEGAILPSPTFNKFALQASIFPAAFCEMLANNGFSTSDANQATLAAVLDNIQLSTDVKPLQVLVPYSPTPVFDCSLASSFRFGLSGNVTSSTLINIPPAGGIVTFFIVSSNPGVWGFTWPAGITNPPDVATESTSNLLSYPFISDGASLFPLDTLVDFVGAELAAFQAAQTSENIGLTNLANAAQTTANTAVTNAAAAQGTANTALTDATTALSDIAALQIVYTRNDVTGNRNFNTTYTNPYGLPMTVTGYGTTTGSRVASVQCFVNGGGDFANTDGATVDGGACGFSFEVPTGATYEVVINSLSGGQSGVTGMGKWIETTKSL